MHCGLLHKREAFLRTEDESTYWAFDFLRLCLAIFLA